MELNWKQTESREQPLEIDNTASPNGVYVRKDIEEIIFKDEYENEHYKYSYKEVFLPKEYKFNITDPEEYKTKLLEVFKEKRQQENKLALQNIESFTTSIGKVKKITPVGTVDVMVNGFLNVVNITNKNLPAGAFRIYVEGVETASPELTPAQVGSFYLEIFNAINEMDKKYKNFENSIKEAKTLDELAAINIIY